MEGWKKLVIGGVATLLAGAAGYFIYKKIKNEGQDSGNKTESGEESKKAGISEEVMEYAARRGKRAEEEEDEEEVLADRREELLVMMEEVLVESIDCLISYCSMMRPDKIPAEKIQQVRGAAKDQIIESLVKIEKNVASSHKWDYTEYEDEIKKYEEKGDKEILTALNTTEEMINTAVLGQKLSLKFTIAPELTKPFTLLLYQWILFSHSYLHYIKIHEFLKGTSRAEPAEIAKVIEKAEPEKIKRRNSLCARYKISKKPQEEYRIALQKAYYTYKLSDPEFEKNIALLFKVHGIIQKNVTQQKIVPELTKDPLEMTEEEFKQFYAELCEKTLKSNETSILTNIAPALVEEAPMAIPVPEPPAKKVKKSIDTAEHITSMQVPLDPLNTSREVLTAAEIKKGIPEFPPTEAKKKIDGADGFEVLEKKDATSAHSDKSVGASDTK